MKSFTPNITNRGLTRGVFVFLLLAMLKHTAWTFDIFENSTINFWQVSMEAWLLAAAFESSIYIFSEKLSKRIEQKKSVRGNFKGLKRFIHKYVNSFTLALFLFMVVSALANTAHAAEFSSPLRIYQTFEFLNEHVYLIAFGSMLPVASFLYANTMANEVIDEEDLDEEFLELRKENKQLKIQSKAFAELQPFLDGKSKNEDKILALNNFFTAQGLEIPQTVIANWVQVSPSYVSNVLKKNGDSTGARI